MKWKQAIAGALMTVVVGCSGGDPEETVELKRFLENKDSGIPAAVLVSDGLLLHTTQLFPKKVEGGEADATVTGQLGELLKELDSILKEHGSDGKSVAKLNVYVSDPGDCAKARETVSQHFAQGSKPAITVISTPLPRPAAKVALDAVAVVAKSEMPVGVEVFSDLASEKGRTFGGEALAAVPGAETDLIYISGRASKADDLATGTKGTMEQLMSVLQILGGGPQHVVQIKAFVNPMTEVTFAAESIQSFFDKGDRPPVVMVEWISSSYPTEIEMIAAIPDRNTETDSLQYFTPPGDKSSPVYSKVAVLKDHDVIYIGEMTGDVDVSPDAEVKTLFDRMKEAAEAAGSDFRHLVKATYYVSDAEVSKGLNTFRPTVYDPERPPTASKIMVKDIGVAKRGMLIDMIAVPVVGE